MPVPVSISVPLVIEQGYDQSRSGIVLIEMALIAPPAGLDLYVVQGARKRGRTSEVIMRTLPNLMVMLSMAAALIAFPQIALFPPDAMQ